MTDDAAWLVTAAGHVYETSSLGDARSFEAVVGKDGYADDLNTEPITDTERLRKIAAQLRGIADRLGG